jgi:hypothetical protein
LDSNANGKKECSIMMIVDGYVVIVGVVFATAWAGANNWAMKEGAYWARYQLPAMQVVSVQISQRTVALASIYGASHLAAATKN